MERCWAEESHQRPEFDEIKSTLLQAKESVEFSFQRHREINDEHLCQDVLNVGSKVFYIIVCNLLFLSSFRISN